MSQPGQRSAHAIAELDKLAADKVEFGSFSLSSEGELVRGDAANVVEFTFAHDGIQYIARAEHRGEEGVLDVVGHLGLVPYSAESPEQRKTLFDRLNHHSDTGFGRVAVTPNQELVVTGPVAVALPITAVNILTAVTEFLLHVEPLAREFAPLAVRRAAPKTDPAVSSAAT
jgi:hypothetical protein